MVPFESVAGLSAQPRAQFDLPSGTMLGKYEILRKLAMGGMAEIYLARSRGQAGFEKLVVIKRILPTVANDPKFVEMFLDEARLAATLQHPNIADVYEVGDHTGSPFFAMEFIHGKDVRSMRMAAREKKEQLPLAIALAIVHGTASALDHAHERVGPDGQNQGLVYRDVSTSNILVSYEGAIKLIDFGIARATSSTHQTQTGTLKGKIPYMSPEQCRGQPLDRRSDIFSLGVVLYELTVGRRPFSGENDFAIMDAIVRGSATPPSQAVRGYPAELEAITLKMLARNRNERYQSLEEMLHDIEPFLHTNRLWVSPKQLSKYMRTVFADDVAAWDKALEDGQTLAQHVAATSTGQSGSSELLTPPSAFPAVAPLSELMPAVRASSQLGVATPPPDVLQRLPAAPPEMVQTPRPASQAQTPVHPEWPGPKRSRVLPVLLGLAALAGGGYFAFTIVRDQQSARTAESEAAPAPAAETRQMEAKPAEPPPTVEPSGQAAPDTTAPDTTAPDTTAPDKAAVDAPPPAEKKPAAAEPVAPAPVEEPVASVEKEPERPTKNDRRRPPPKKVVKASTPPKEVKPPAKETPKETTPKDTAKDTAKDAAKDTAKDKQKDPNWTSDSPFLPP
jgi:serine/threonine protein kinase